MPPGNGCSSPAWFVEPTRDACRAAGSCGAELGLEAAKAAGAYQTNHALVGSGCDDRAISAILPSMSQASPPLTIDVNERGKERDGQPQVMNRRLFMQLLVFESPRRTKPEDTLTSLKAGLEAAGVQSVLYEDVNHPAGFGLLTWSERPAHFVTSVRPALAESLELGLRLRTEFTMMGRAYSSGFEPDLEYWVLKRPVETALNPAWPWAVWYPLRRGGAFERLERKEKVGILHEHASIGKAYGEANLAHDIRLACHGLDEHDNEFLIGLVGEELHPLSHIVQRMRSTRQTSEFILQMGPFFVGHRVWALAGGR